MRSNVKPDAIPSGPGGATLAVNAGVPYEVIAYSFGEGGGRSPTDMGSPRLIALVLIRPEDESWIHDTEEDQRELVCLLDPSAPKSQIGAFTFMGRVSGFRNLRDRRLAVEFSSVGPVTLHFLRG